MQRFIVGRGDLVSVAVPVGTEFFDHNATHLVNVIEGFLIAR